MNHDTGHAPFPLRCSTPPRDLGFVPEWLVRVVREIQQQHFTGKLVFNFRDGVPNQEATKVEIDVRKMLTGASPSVSSPQ